MSERLNNKQAPVDVLQDIFETLRFRGSVFFRSQLSAPWGMALQQLDVPRFHIIRSGSCYVGADNETAVNVREMEIVLLPGGHSHWIADQPGRELVSAELASEACELGSPLFQQGTVTNQITCGLVSFDQDTAPLILGSLPKILHFPKLHADAPAWVTATLIENEIERTGSRHGLIVDRLTEVLFLQLLNAYVENCESKIGLFSALRDRRIHSALSLIHNRPEEDWSVAQLGQLVGMSRATLTRRFQESLGVSPMTYIANWRMTKAFQLVSYSGQSFEEIADAVGFSSARTLSKAFKRHFGKNPNVVRREGSAR